MLKAPASVRKGFPGAGLIPQQDRESCGESRLPRFRGIAHRSGLLYAVQKEQTRTGKLKNLILQPKTCWQTTRGPARHDWRRLCMRPCRIILTPMIRKEAVTDLSGNTLVSSFNIRFIHLLLHCCSLPDGFHVAAHSSTARARKQMQVRREAKRVLKR